MARAEVSETSEHDVASQEGVALLVIDMVNCFDFPSAEKLKPAAEEAALRIAALIAHAREAGYPIIYVNDNFGEWHSEKSRLIETAKAAGSEALTAVRPEDEDYFIIKPQFSGFYATNLPVLLPKLGVSSLVLTGIATDICISLRQTRTCGTMPSGSLKTALLPKSPTAENGRLRLCGSRWARRRDLVI